MAKKLNYPLAETNEQKKASKSNRIEKMKPEKFLSQSQNLEMNAGDKAVIKAMKKHIKQHDPMGPLKLYNDGQDGRHRATAAKELGVDAVPVINYRKKKRASGGSAYSDVPKMRDIPTGDNEAYFRRLINYSFAVNQLYNPKTHDNRPDPFRPTYTPIPYGRAEGGKVLEDDFPSHYMPGVGRQVMADGGEAAKIEAAIQAANEVASRRGMEHEHGVSGAVEFAPVNIREPLTGYSAQIGQLPKETAQVVEPALQAASEIAPYFTPAAPLAAARDVAVGLREGDPTNVALSALGLPGRAAKAAAVGAASLMPEDAEAGIIGKAMNVIRAYHGSPHKFDKFDISKIGTGEGAQAYGHGLYFAQSEPVARSYRDAISQAKGAADIIDKSGKPIVAETPAQQRAVGLLGSWSGDYDNLIKELSKSDSKNDVVSELNKMREIGASYKQPGHMYEVDIHANPEHMLDWDKPLLQQSRHVIDRFNDAVAPVRDADDAMLRELLGDKSAHASLNLFDRSKGSQAYNTFAGERGGPSAVSERLREAGIPGIKYLDQGSRGAGEGTSNYVVFDPNIIDILRRYTNGGRVEKAAGGQMIEKALQIVRDLSKNVPYGDKMGVFHSLNQNRLPLLKELGGIPSPSLAITKTQLVPTEFGDTLLVGRPHLAVPSEENVVHGSDMFSPRFPDTVSGYEGKKFLTTRDENAQRLPATMENILEQMLSGRMTGAEKGTEGASGRLVMNVNKPITSIEELMKSRHRLPETRREHIEGIEDLNRNLDALGGLLHQYQTDPSRRDYSSYLAEALNAKLERGPEAFSQYYGPLGKQHEYVPRSIEQTAREVMPDYFEAKPKRGIGFDEFAGALVNPDHYGKMAAERLEAAGIPAANIHYTDLEHPDTFGTDIYKKFGEHLFADGGTVEQESNQPQPGLVDRALQFVSQFNPVSSAQAGPLSESINIAKRIIREKPAQVELEHALKRVVSPFSSDPDQVKQALDIAQKYRILQDVTGPKTAFYNVSQSRPVKDVTSTITDIPGLNLRQENPMTWEDFYNQAKGASFINLGGDRSNFGRLTHINDKELAWPVDLHAGTKYMLEPSPGAIWANAPGPATGFKNAVTRMAEQGDVYGVFSPMGPQAVDSSHNMFDALMAQMPGQKITKKSMKAFDESLKSGAHGSSPKEKAKFAEVMENWPGISNPKEASEFARTLSGGHRRAIVQHMDKGDWRDLGFPMVGETRVAIADPALKGMPQGMMGHRIVKFDPKNITPETSFEHSTYPVATGGEYVGDVPAVLRHYAMPEALENIVKQPAKDMSIIHPFSVDPLGRSSARKFFEEQPLQQTVNQRFLDSVMKGIERQSQYGLKDGGSIVDDALDVVSNLPKNRKKRDAA